MAKNGPGGRLTKTMLTPEQREKRDARRAAKKARRAEAEASLPTLGIAVGDGIATKERIS